MLRGLVFGLWFRVFSASYIDFSGSTKSGCGEDAIAVFITTVSIADISVQDVHKPSVT